MIRLSDFSPFVQRRKGGFSEGRHKRDSKGRFAPKGAAGQRRIKVPGGGPTPRRIRFPGARG